MTVGWIFEGDRERFLSARERAPDQTPALPSFRCPFCKDSFPDRTQLSVHIHALHTVERPFILFGGLEPGAEDVVRTVIDSASLEVFNCTELAVGFNGAPPQSVQRDELARQLSRLRRAAVRIRLVNAGDGLVQPVTQEYRLRLIAPDSTSLARADELFISTFGAGEVNLEKVASFYQITRDGWASEYAEALADYVRAALIKDGDKNTGVSSRLHHYREIQNRALSILQVFDRPVARLLSSLIRFGLNDFSHWQDTGGFAKLDEANAILGPLAVGDRTQPREAMTERTTTRDPLFVCPVDIGTDTVTRLAEQMTKLSRWGLAAEEQIIAISDAASVDNLDRAKIRALWAVTALRLDANESAGRALSLLDGDATFGAWAGNKLARIEL